MTTMRFMSGVKCWGAVVQVKWSGAPLRRLQALLQAGAGAQVVQVCALSVTSRICLLPPIFTSKSKAKEFEG